MEMRGRDYLAGFKMATDGNHAIQEQHEPGGPGADDPDEHNEPSNGAQFASSAHPSLVPCSLQHIEQSCFQNQTVPHCYLHS